MTKNKTHYYLKMCLDGDVLLVKKIFSKLNKNEIELINDENNANCIHYAARKGHIKVLEYFILEKQVSAQLKSSVGATILHDAAANSQTDTILWILKNTNLKITTKDNDGATVLHIASKCGQKKLIEWYFKYFDCRNATITTSNGATCLHFACVSGSYMCVKQIVEAAPEIINMKAKNGLTPIYLAVQGNHLDIVKLLTTEYKASIFERDSDGMSLLHVACQNGCLDVLKWLIEMKGFNINDVDTKGATGLHYSCINGHPNVVFYLLSRNARIKADYFGGTPLHDCASSNQIECARLLLTNKCDVKIIDFKKLTAYELAVSKGFNQLANEIKLVEDINCFMDDRETMRATDSIRSCRDQPNRNAFFSKINSDKYDTIEEEENTLNDFDAMINQYDNISLHKNNQEHSCSDVHHIECHNQHNTIENSTNTSESINLTNASSCFPSPPSPDNLRQMRNRNTKDNSVESVEDARLGVNCSSENLAIAIHTEISSDVEQQEKNESILVTHSDSFGEIGSRNSILSRIRNDPFIDELNELIKKRAPELNTKMSNERNNNIPSSINNNHEDFVKESVGQRIPIWKKKLLDEKNENKINEADPIITEGSSVISKPQGISELESKKEDNLIMKNEEIS